MRRNSWILGFRNVSQCFILNKDGFCKNCRWLWWLLCWKTALISHITLLDIERKKNVGSCRVPNVPNGSKWLETSVEPKCWSINSCHHLYETMYGRTGCFWAQFPSLSIHLCDPYAMRMVHNMESRHVKSESSPTAFTKQNCIYS